RFREIDLQARGHEAFTTPSVVKALDITAKQKEQFEANAKQVEDDIAQATQKPVTVAAPGGGVTVGGFNSADHEKVVRSARAEGLKRALEVLTDEQKTAWKKLTGEPFAHPFPLPASALKGVRSGFVGGAAGGAVRPVPAPPVPV